MVTVQEAKSQIATQRAAVESQRQQIQQRTQQPKLTALQVRQQTRSSLAQRQTQAKQLSSIRKQALQTLQPIEVQITKAEGEVRSVESQIASQQQRQADIETAKKLFRKGIVDPGASPSVKKIIRELQAGREVAVTKIEREGIAELEKKGLEPIFVNGELRGIEDFLRQQSRTLEQLEPVVINGKLVGFQDIAQQLSRQLREPIAVEVTPPEIPPGVVKPAETKIEALVRNIKESTPQFKFVKNQVIRDLLIKSSPAKNIGRIIGGEKFARSELKRILADPTGKFKFRPDQAEALGELIAEVGEGFALGLGVGKGVTLLRGAAARIIPTALKGSKKFDDVLKVAATLGIVTLTTAQAVSIKNTFEREGSDAAILQTIGFISFGAGFGVTGLKSLPQAEREFKQLTDLLKKAIPPGKRGQTSFDELGSFLKKKKGGRFGELESLDPSDIDEGTALLAAIERRLANAKNAKEQAKILAEIKKGLNTKQAKQNFENFVLGLIEKDIIKLPKVEILPGVKAKGLPAVKGIKAFVPKIKTPGRLREIARVKQNQARNQRRITRANISLGKKFAQAQTAVQITKLGVAQKTTQRQRQLQKQIQKTKQTTRTGQRLRQRQLLAQRQVSKLALRQLLRTSLRSTLGKPRIRRFRRFAPIPPIIPKKAKVKRVKKFLDFDIKGESFNVLVRRKGKFVKIFGGLPENRAKRRLLNVLDKTLAASGRITPSKVKPIKKDIKKLNIPAATFRKPVPKSPLRKKNTFTIIERRNKRLNTKTEVQAIQRARKLKKVPMNLRVK